MDYEEAKAYFAEDWRWHLHQETFQPLDSERWICKVTTMFRTERGEPEVTFFLLYDVETHQQFKLYEASIPALRDWCLKTSPKKSE